MMINLLFSAQGRIGRGSFWKGIVLLTLVSLAAVAASIWLGARASAGDDGTLHFEFNTAGSIPATLITLATTIAATWAGVCLGIKRYHDRGKSGVWVLIQFVPVIGAFWYLIEAGFLPGTPGPNSYGPARDGSLAPGAVAAF